MHSQVLQEERRRIARELHDEAGQSLLLIRLQLELMQKQLPPSSRQLRAKLEETRRLTERTILEIRRIVAALRPAALERTELRVAVRQLTRRFRKVYPGQIRLRLHPLPKLSEETEVVTYRVLQECFQNIAKHSRAAHVNVFLGSSDKSLDLIVEDDGVGFQAARRHNSRGLAGIKERVQSLGGSLEVSSRPERGARVSVNLPL